MVRAARRIPLRPKVRQRGLNRLGKGQHQRPARRYADRSQCRLQRLALLRTEQQALRLRRRDGQHDRVKTRMNPARARAFGLQLPALRMQLVGFDLHDFGLQQKLVGLKQRPGPMLHQRIHAGRGHPVRFP